MKPFPIMAAVALVVNVLLSGCLAATFGECELPREDHESSASASHEIWAKWNHTYTEDEWARGEAVEFGVRALRTSPPSPPAGDHDVTNDTELSVDWSKVRASTHLGVLHDLLCVSDWKARYLIPAGNTFSTYTGVSDQLFEEAVEALRDEFEHQNGVPASGQWCCYILYEGEFYATSTRVAVSS